MAQFTPEYSVEIREVVVDEITYDEAIINFENHFERYRFYPPLYNHLNVGDESYSSLVIKKDFETNEFSIFLNPNIEDVKYNCLNLNKALEIYIGEELKYSICGIKINKKH